VKVTKDIGAPLETVFALFSDVHYVPQYVSGIKGIKLLTPGHFALGTAGPKRAKCSGVRTTCR
jgi:hypothetical protein